MLRNYLLIAIRNLQRNPVYSFINVTGLSIGIASSILILLWVADEVSYNRFHANYDHLYKVYMNQEFSGKIGTGPTVPYPLKEALRNASGQIKHVAMTNYGEGNLLASGENRINKVGLCVSEDFLKMFTFRMIQGDANSALADPSSIVLTASTAKALFGDNDPLNKYVKIDNDREMKVTGIVDDVPSQSTFTFQYLLPFAFYEATQPWVARSRDSWRNNSFQMYVELQPGSSLSDVNTSIQYLVKNNNVEARTAEVFLHPMNKWRLYSNFENGKVSGGMIEYVQLFTAIAIFVLVIACINFMNLATARSESRAREVGIRKSVGSRRKELIFQFLGESILITLVAFLLSIMVAELVLPGYNMLVDKKLFIDYANPALWLAGVIVILVTGIAAGSYPAFYLSAFQPVKVLKGKVQVGKGASTPRKILVTLQFGFSIFLIIGTLVIYQQIMHVKNREVGYNRENLMLIWTNSEIETRFQTIKDELKGTGVVKAVCKSNSPVTRVFSTAEVEWPGKQPDLRVSFTSIATEYDYTETMGIKMIEGRDFSRDFKSDSSAIVINKAALDLMGLKNPIGEKLKMWGGEWTIVGVMENVVMDSPYEPVAPLVMVFSPDWSSTISVRLEKTSDLPEAIAKVENVFKKLNPTNPLWYRFADMEFQTKFSSINLISRLAGIFASLAIAITCLGLFGLAAFTAEQRKKEVGIRKVMGATVSGIVLLISKDFSRLVFFAFVIAAPLAWLLLNNFLERYPYRVGIAWWVLPLAGIGSLMLALLIVGAQATRAARSNPVESLRSE
jgi:putative ABC transport system permease protein